VKLSFRDPDGFVFRCDDQIFRCVYPHAVDDLKGFLASPECHELMTEGHLVQSEILPEHSCRSLADPLPTGSSLIRHAPVRFPNYPHEWSPEMLHSAGELTLDVAHKALKAGFSLKDATPQNIMFDGAKPVFIDLLSFERRNAEEGLWRPYAQFVRTFLYPLLASRLFGLRLDEIFMVHRDGLEPERMAQLAPSWRWFTPLFFSLVTLPRLLSIGAERSAPKRYRERPCRDNDEASFLKRRMLARARKALDKARGSSRGSSAVARYMEAEQSYSAEEFTTKETFVTSVLERYRPKRVLDAGCNTGHFSRVAVRCGASVVAVDQDAASIGLLWQSARASGADILPLVVNLARPTPGIGWANQEALSFLARAEGKFDCVLMLALLHHLVVSERVPLDYVFGLAARLSTDMLVMEYVDPSDAQFRRIARGREILHSDLTRSAFESAAASLFDILEQYDISPTRRIYALKRRPC
jgi:SAM-dependent methyltransferase